MKNILTSLLCFLVVAAMKAQDFVELDNEDFTFKEITIADDDGLHSWSDIEQFYQSDDGALWAQVNEGVFRYNGHASVNVTRYLSTKNTRLDDQAATKFLFDDEGNLWLGRRKGLFKINFESKEIKKIYTDQPQHSLDWRNYILELEALHDTIYVGSANGLYLIDQKSGKKIIGYLTNGKDVKHRESSKSVQSIFPNIEKDAIWVTLMDGFYRIDKKKGIHEQFLVTNVWPDSLAHNFSEGHLVKNKLYLPSYGLGMVEFNFDDRKFKRYPTNASYANDYTYNVIRSAIKLSDSTFLINATKMGNAIFNVNTKSYRWLPTPEIFKEGVFLYLDKSGYVWGSKRGRLFRTLKPIMPTDRKGKAVLDVSAVFANGKLVSRPSIDSYNLIELREEENSIRLDFSLTQPYLYENIVYECQLNNSAWQPVNRNNQLELFGLKSGKHTIGLRAKDDNGQILASAELPLLRIVPFYKTATFFMLLGIVLLLLSYFLLNYFNQRALTKKLKELDAAKSNFFTNISHELRTPLSLIKGPIAQQISQDDDSTGQIRGLKIALKNTNRLQELVSQIMDLSKLESGYYRLKVSQNNGKQFLKSLVNSFDYAAKKKNHKFQVSLSDIEEIVWYDKEVLLKIVTNLLGNALKYSPEGSLIEFVGKTSNDKLTLTVKNTGTSLTDKEREQIFQRYYRSSDENVGTGIGLALTKQLVELHKGSITVESGHNHVLFHLEIPVAKSFYNKNEIWQVDTKVQTVPEQPIPVEILKEPELKNNTKEKKPILLIVEDNEDLQQFVASLFEEDFKLILAKNGKKAFELAKKNIPDIIITDLMMPKEDGITLTKNCKSEDTTSHIPIVMLTAKAGDENELLGLETGANGYVTKPFNPKLLKQKVNNLLETQKKLQNRFSKEIILTPQDISINSYDERFLTSLQDVLDKQLTDSDFSVKEFAKSLGMSRMQLHRKLRALTGQTTTEFIRTQRLKLAADLLKTSDVNVSEIGYTVGFNNHSYFTKCFKEIYNCTPSAFLNS